MIIRFILALMLAVVPAISQACQCTLIPPDQLVRGATLVFIGQTNVPQIVVPPGGASFRDRQIFKGVQLTTPVVANNRPDGDSDCAFQFMMPVKYLVVAYGSYDAGYYTDKCIMDQANGADAKARDHIMAYAGRYFLEQQNYIGSLGPTDMRDLIYLRKSAAFYLQQHSAEQALSFYKYATDVSRGSLPDLQGQGEAQLQLGNARDALTRFDDVLEKDNTRQDAWQGRYRALALMGRWSELPEKPDLTGLEWQRSELKSDLLNAVLSKAWWVDIKADGRKLTGNDFSNAELSVVSFRNSDLTGSNFSNARLFDVDFTGATLKDTNFDHVNYEQVKWPEGFTPPPSTPLLGVAQSQQQ